MKQFIFTDAQKKTIKIYLIICVILGLIIGIRAGYRAGRKDKAVTVKTEMNDNDFSGTGLLGMACTCM